MASLPGDLINANRLNTGQIWVLTPSDHGMLDRAKDMTPGGTKGLSHLFPAKMLCPTRQKPGIGFGQPVLTGHPRHLLDPDTPGWTLNRAGHL